MNDSTWTPVDRHLPDPGDVTLAESQERFAQNLNNGTTCPCCGKYGKRYERSINATMVRSLIWLVRASGRDRKWVNVAEDAPMHVQRSKQLPTTRLWFLVERKPADPDDASRKTSGIWRPTQFGVDFVNREATVPNKVHEYRGEPESWSGDRVDVLDALGERFNYGELMGWS